MRKSDTQNIQEIIKQIFKQQGLEKPLKEVRLIKSWETVVGPFVAKYTKNLYIRNKVLFVQLTSSVVRNELMMVREKLLISLNQEAGGDVIKEIVLR